MSRPAPARLAVARALALAILAFAGPAPAAFPPLPAGTAVEFHHRELDHYFITQIPDEIAALDAGHLPGWTRTGRGFVVLASAAGGANPVCRFYIPPQHGNSHFYSASPAECEIVLGRIGTDPNFSGYVHESPDVFYAVLPDTVTGACPAGMTPVFRLWNARADSNHRYAVDPGIKAAMEAKGYIAEGYGPLPASMCTSAEVLVDAVTVASGATPFALNCEGVASGGIAYRGTEVEPYLAANPANPNNLIAVWQQDRWSNGAARGNAGAYSFDGGGTWTPVSVPFSRCSGGNAANGGDWERATDPWVTFGPDGTAHWMALALNNVGNADNAMLAARSTDGGRTWSAPATLRRDDGSSFNDKNAITADPTDARFVYAAWDRITGNNGPTWFAWTVDAGLTWEPAREIYAPGANRQTINNQVVVLPDGTLVLHFTELPTVDSGPLLLRIIRSADRGATWSPPITIAAFASVGTVDPGSGTRIRDGSILASIAAGADGSIALAWQDARFSTGHDAIAFSRSSDGGLTWSAPVRVNGDPSVAAFLPAVAIRDDGTIGVAYYDLRADTPAAATLPTLHWLATSSDGIAWSERVLAGPFDYMLAPRASGLLFLGDYMALVPLGTSFVALSATTTPIATSASDVTAALARSPAPTASSLASRVKSETVPVAIPPELADRAAAHAQGVLAERLRERALPR